MRIVAAVSRFPYPIEKGDKLRIYYQLQYLSQHHDVTLVTLAEKRPSDEDIKEIKKVCSELHIIYLPLFRRYLNLLRSLISRVPFQVNYFRSGQMRKTINRLIKKQHPDIVYVQLLRLGKNIPFKAGVSYYMDFMDSFAEGMRKRFRFSKWYEKPFVALEAVKLNDYQRQIAEKFEGYSVISDPDKFTFPLEIQREMDIIPNGVNEEYFTVRKEAPEYDIIFTGNMGYHPNILACKYLINEVVPRLRKRGIKPVVCLAGARPSPEVKALESENVLVTGFVEDLKYYLNRSLVFVAPLFSGSGLQNKLLESMAAGLPTVTSSLTNQSLRASAGKEIMTADNSEEFADIIYELLTNKEKAKKLGEAGRCFIEENYRWTRCNRKLENRLYEISGKEK